MEVIDDDGSVSSNPERVFDVWKSEFSDLYNGINTDSTEFDQSHFTRSKSHKQSLELNLMDPLYMDITIEEVSRAVMSARSRSASGIDNIPYAVLKLPPVIAALQCLFQLIFDTSIIPTEWRKSIICPLLKDTNSDPRIPLNYRGISLLPCISKLF